MSAFDFKLSTKSLWGPGQCKTPPNIVDGQLLNLQNIMHCLEVESQELY